jgi:hypothetical protein
MQPPSNPTLSNPRNHPSLLSMLQLRLKKFRLPLLQRNLSSRLPKAQRPQIRLQSLPQSLPTRPLNLLRHLPDLLSSPRRRPRHRLTHPLTLSRNLTKLPLNRLRLSSKPNNLPLNQLRLLLKKVPLNQLRRLSNLLKPLLTLTLDLLLSLLLNLRQQKRLQKLSPNLKRLLSHLSKRVLTLPLKLLKKLPL